MRPRAAIKRPAPHRRPARARLLLVNLNASHKNNLMEAEWGSSPLCRMASPSEVGDPFCDEPRRLQPQLVQSAMSEGGEDYRRRAAELRAKAAAPAFEMVKLEFEM